MPNAKPRRRPPLLKTLPYFLPALLAVALAAFGAHPLALLPLLIADTLCMAAVCHAVGFDPEPSLLRTVLRRGATHLILFSVYAAIVFLLVAWPLLALAHAPSLAATLGLCAALVAALALLWRLWPVFGLVYLWDDAFPEGEEHSWISTALMRSVAFAWHLTGEQRHFFTHFLPAALAYLALAFCGLALTGIGSVLPDELRTAALILYAFALLPLCTLLTANRTLRLLLCERREVRNAPSGPGSPAAAGGTPGSPVTTSADPAGNTPDPPLSPAALADALLDAALNGRVEDALALLARGADPDTLSPTGARDQRSALVLAALLPDTRLLRALIARGAQVNRVHAGVTALLAATRDSYHGRAEAVMTLLANGADPRLADADGNTPLHHAALAADATVAAILVDAQAPLEALNRNRFSPLGMAAGVANWPLLRYLLDHGARSEPAQGQPALLAAASIADDNPEGVRILLRHKARVDATDALGRTALMNAALEGHTQIVRVLLEAGADASLADRHGTTALMEAARAGATGALSALVGARPDPLARDAHGRDALMLACQSPRANTACVRALLALGADPRSKGGDGRSALEHATGSGRWDLVAALDPSTPLPSSHAIAAQPEPGADTPAHLLDALRFGHWAVVAGFAARVATWPRAELAALYYDLADGAHQQARRWLLENGLPAEAKLDDGPRLLDALLDRLPASTDAVGELLDAGATPAGTGGFARALARLADVAESAPFAMQLLERGADMFGADATGRTPLHHAACAALAPVLRALLERGVDPNVRDRGGATPLHVALNTGHDALPLVRALIAHGANPESPAANGETPLGLTLARGDATLENWLRWNVWPLPHRALRATDLHAAAASGDPDAVSRLLELGFTVDARDGRGATALLRACGAGHTEAAQRLLDAGADTGLAAESGATPLSAAISARHDEIVALLLRHGARIDQRLPGDATALMVAAALGFPEIAEALLERGADPALTDGRGHAALHAAACFCFDSRDSLRCRRLLDALLGRGAGVDAVDSEGSTPLLLLLGAQSRPGRNSDDTHLGALLPALLDAGAAVDHADKRGVTALHACAMHALFAPARVLLSRGASRESVDAFGRTPADVARVLGLVDLAMELAPRPAPAISRTPRRPAQPAE